MLFDKLVFMVFYYDYFKSCFSLDFKSWHDNGIPLNAWKIISSQSHEIILKNNTWLKKMLFHPSCQLARKTACSLFLSLMTEKHRRRLFIDLLIEYLPEVIVILDI